MTRFLLLAFTLLYFAPVSAHASAAPRYTACAKLKNFQTATIVNLMIPEPTYDLKKTREALNKNKKKSHEEWLKFHKMESIWRADEMETLGEAAGGWGLSSRLRMTAVPFDSFGSSYCPYFQSIGLDMMYRTIISIPSEFRPGGCAYNVIKEHELRHHATNAAIVKAMVERMKHDLPTIVADIENSTSYIPRNQSSARWLSMQTDLTAVFKIYLEDSMRAEMQRQNRAVDSPDEYKKASAAISACRD